MTELDKDGLEAAKLVREEINAAFAGCPKYPACLKGANDWRPIETAPKDWTDILTYTPPENHRLGVICGIHVGCFRTDLMVWHLSDDEWELSPTHWRPLPSPPKEG